MLLYYITDRTQLARDESGRRSALLAKIEEAAQAGVDYIQIREKDLSDGELERLGREAIAVVRKNSKTTCLLINSRLDVALATGTDGVHLRSEDLAVSVVRAIWKQCSAHNPIIGISCHLPADIVRAEAEGADFAVFGPVFEKNGSVPAGIAVFREACLVKMPVLALGGVTAENALACLEAGASGIAGIRLFQENRIEKVVRMWRAVTRASGRSSDSAP